MLAVLDDPDVEDIAIFEKLGDRLDGGIVGEVAKMGGEWGLVGQRLGEVITERVVTC